MELNESLKFTQQLSGVSQPLSKERGTNAGGLASEVAILFMSCAEYFLLSCQFD